MTITNCETPPWNALDAGIVDLVRLLWSAGFRTTDSGDGVSKPGAGRVFPFRHVFCQGIPATLVTEADRAARLLSSTVDAHMTIEATYRPTDGVGIIAVLDLTNIKHQECG